MRRGSRCSESRVWRGEREAGLLSSDGERVVAWSCRKGLFSLLFHKRSMGSISRSGKVSWAKARALDVAEGSARSMWGVLFLLRRILFGGRKTDDGPRLPRQSRRRRLPNPTHRTNLTFPPDRRPTPVRWGQRRCGCESCTRLAGLRRSHWQRPPAPLYLCSLWRVKRKKTAALGTLRATIPLAVWTNVGYA